MKNNQIYSISKADVQRSKKNVYHFSTPASCAKRGSRPKNISKSGNSDGHRQKNNIRRVEEQEQSKLAHTIQKNIIQKTILFLDNYFSRNHSKAYSLDIALFPRGTEFQKKVWKYLLKIPWGQTRTYAEVANMVGSPSATRAVGSACAKNPYLILVPCHRVVAQKGLGGFSLGLPVKVRLLNLEKPLFH